MTHDESFFREVDEDYRRHQLVQTFERYGAYFIGAAFVIIAVVAGYSVDKWRSAQQGAKGGDAFTNALNLSDNGKQDEASKAWSALASNGPPTYKVLARLHLAAESVANKQKDKAIADYRAVADDGTAPQELRNFAKLQLASLQIDTESYDKLAQQLEPFRSGTSRWRFFATETLGFSALKEGKKPEAERLFTEIISDGGSPKGMRQRAQVMLALLLEKPKAEQAKPAAKGDTPNDAKTQ
jgi:hypothetical protein